MKIGIVADGPEISGSMKYILQICSRLKKKENTSFFHLMYEGRLNLNSLNVEELNSIKLPFFNYFFNFGFYFPIKTCLKSASNSLEIVHFSRHYPFFIFWHKLFTKSKVVVTSLDLYNLDKRYLFFLKNALKRADKIIAISNATKKQLIKLGIDENKIEVVYLGADNKIFKPIGKNKAIKLLSETKLEDKLEVFKKADKILLSVSNDTRRKNTRKVYEAFSKFLKKNPNALLIRVVSVPDEKTIAIQNKRFGKNIIFLGNLSEKELSLLYNISDLLIFPSICEGFGLPLLESISCGTPCVTSNFEPMTEVVGDSGALVDPYNSESIYKGVVECLANRKVLTKKALKRAKFFSLEKNFSETYKIYRSLLKN